MNVSKQTDTIIEILEENKASDRLKRIKKKLKLHQLV